MASWANFVQYVRANYKIADETPDAVSMIFDTGGGRSQLLFLFHRRLMDGKEDWVQIESPFADLAASNLRRVLEEVGQLVCGGAVATGDKVVFRHSLPLANMDPNEFERPLILVVTSADRLEQKLTGGDRY